MSGARSARRARSRLGAIGAALLVLVGAASVQPASPVEAAWSDDEIATATVAAGTVSAPTKSGSCSIGLLGTAVTYGWAAPAGGVARTGYVVEVVRSNGVIAYTTTLAATATSWTGSGLLSALVLGETYTVRIVAVSGSWRSTAITGTLTTSLLGLISGCTW